MGMMSDMEHEDYGPKRRAAEKAIGQTRDFLVDQATDPLNYLGPAGKGLGVGAKVARGLFATTLAGKADDANAMFFGGKYLPAAYVKQIEEALLSGKETFESIFKKTGYFKNPQGQWRKYIPDKDASVNPTGYLQNYGTRKPLGDSLVHPDLYRADQNLTKVPTSREPMSADDYGAYYAGSKRIEANSSLDMKKYLSALLHETQHHIQNVGGTTTGGSPQLFYGKWQTPKIQQALESVDKLKEVYKAAYGVSYEDVQKMLMTSWRDYNNLPKDAKEAWVKINQVSLKGNGLRLSAPSRIPFQKYKNIPGEVEARVTQQAANRNLMAEDNGLQELYDLFGKEISNPDFYFDPAVQ